MESLEEGFFNPERGAAAYGKTKIDLWNKLIKRVGAAKLGELAPLANLRADVAKIENSIGGGVELTVELRTSEGFIDQKATGKFKKVARVRDADLALPDVPAKLWPKPSRGRPASDDAERLIAFIRDVYRRYIATHRNELRSYIYNQDRHLYVAIQNFERKNVLPEDIWMPKRTRRMIRLEAAEKVNFAGMTPGQRMKAEKQLEEARSREAALKEARSRDRPKQTIT